MLSYHYCTLCCLGIRVSEIKFFGRCSFLTYYCTLWWLNICILRILSLISSRGRYLWMVHFMLVGQAVVEPIHPHSNWSSFHFHMIYYFVSLEWDRHRLSLPGIEILRISGFCKHYLKCLQNLNVWSFRQLDKIFNDELVGAHLDETFVWKSFHLKSLM